MKRAIAAYKRAGQISVYRTQCLIVMHAGVPYFTAETVDDVTQEAIEAILDRGHHVTSSTEGANTELLGVTLHITNPRARLSRTEARGKPFSCLGELCWYLSGSNATEQIVYYVSIYKRYDEGGQIFGGYGPRLFSSLGANQVENVVRQLRDKPSSRQAVIQLFDAQDLSYDPATLPQGKKRDIPCTCVLQFFVRDELLQMMTYMRSNDAWFGLTHDLFCFTMIQEIVARTLGREPGPYTHFAGSLHIYDKHLSHAKKLRDEGWQSTNKPMPPMPSGDPWPSIRQLLSAEASIRKGETPQADLPVAVDPYWADLIRLLQAYRYREDGNASGIETLRSQMAAKVFDVYLEKAIQVADSKAKAG